MRTPTLLSRPLREAVAGTVTVTTTTPAVDIGTYDRIVPCGIMRRGRIRANGALGH